MIEIYISHRWAGFGTFPERGGCQRVMEPDLSPRSV